MIMTISKSNGNQDYELYREAIRRRVCAVCLDRADDGTCHLSGQRECSIEKHLPDVISALGSVQSDRMDEYVAAVERQVCGKCEQDTQGYCPVREKGECALSAYLSLVLDAVEEVLESTGRVRRDCTE